MAIKRIPHPEITRDAVESMGGACWHMQSDPIVGHGGEDIPAFYFHGSPRKNKNCKPSLISLWRTHCSEPEKDTDPSTGVAWTDDAFAIACLKLRTPPLDESIVRIEPPKIIYESQQVNHSDGVTFSYTWVMFDSRRIVQCGRKLNEFGVSWHQIHNQPHQWLKDDVSRWAKEMMIERWRAHICEPLYDFDESTGLPWMIETWDAECARLVEESEASDES